jgi:hypothetical protein
VTPAQRREYARHCTRMAYLHLAAAALILVMGVGGFIVLIRLAP